MIQGSESTYPRTCRDCGTMFDITVQQRQWYVDRGLTLPRRCDACLAARKRAQQYLAETATT